MQQTASDGPDHQAASPDAGDPHARRIDSYEQAARLATEAHPLSGEDLRTPHLEDARMWHRVYTELLAFKETLIHDTERALATIAPAAREEVERTDAVILVAERNRFQQRLDLWKRRCDELEVGTG